MTKHVYRRLAGDGRTQYMLGGSNLTEVSGDSVSLCKDAGCINFGNCRIRETILLDHEDMGVVAPIMGCTGYGRRKDGQGNLNFNK